MINAKCKICRRMGVKLFLKGDKCLSPKCPMMRKPYPPGVKKKKGGRRGLSEYGKELKEKQKLKNWYNLGEQQFRKYVKEILKKRRRTGDAALLLVEKLEMRFDNIIFRLGLAVSRAQARQFISHGHFLINGRICNIPSRQLKKGDKVTLHPSSFLRKLKKKYQPPAWLKISPEKLEAEIMGKPTLEMVEPPAEISAIFEYYSR